MTLDPLDHRERAQQDESDVAQNGDGVCERGDAVRPLLDHQAEQRQVHAGLFLNDRDSDKNGDHACDKRAEFGKAVHQRRRLEPQAGRERQRHQNDRQQRAQHGQQVHVIIGRQVHHHAADKAADRRGDRADQNAAGQHRAVIHFEQVERDRDVEQQDAAHCAADDDAGELAHDDIFPRQLHRERIAARIGQQQRGRKHRGRRAEQLVDRADDRPQHHAEHGRRRDHAHHGDCQRAHGLKALVKRRAVAALVALRLVDRAEQQEYHHDGHDHGIERQVLRILPDAVGEHRPVAHFRPKLCKHRSCPRFILVKRPACAAGQPSLLSLKIMEIRTRVNGHACVSRNAAK